VGAKIRLFFVLASKNVQKSRIFYFSNSFSLIINDLKNYLDKECNKCLLLELKNRIFAGSNQGLPKLIWI
jgi:hypothetical protein